MTTSTKADREKLKKDFLKSAGWDKAKRVSLGEDASTRSYERLTLDDKTAILMNAPPAAEGRPCGDNASVAERLKAGWNGRTRLAACRVDAFVSVGEYLRQLGLSAPGIYAYDVENGLCLLEDLGDTVYAREIEKGADEEKLYLYATHVLAHVHNHPAPTSVQAGDYTWPILTYDRLALTTGADLFPKWYPGYDDRVKFSGALARQYDEVVSDLSAHLESLPQVLMLRDYHAENLIWLPERDGMKKVGILDYQDAVRGPAAWDLAMFIQDARRDVSPEISETVFQRYLDLTDQQEDDFRRDFAIAGAINALRIIGVFARLIGRDKKDRYAAFLPREWGHLKTSLSHPALTDLRLILAKAAPFLTSET